MLFILNFVEQVILSKEEQNKVDAEQQFDRIYLASDTININGEWVQGRKYQLSDKTSIQQLAVLHQNTEEVINGKTISVGGGKASCGYQTIKNAFIALNWGKNISDPLNSTQISREACAMPSDEVIGDLRKQIIGLRRGCPAWNNSDEWFREGEWLTEEELRELIKNGNF
ncbi:MAG: hypothetical protein WCD44_04310 [Candidatus Babeliales bacterium]